MTIDRMAANDAELREMSAMELANVPVARIICEAGTAEGLAQRQLADLIRSRRPVLAKLKDADYEGHPLSVPDPIALRLGPRLHVDVVPRQWQDLQST